MTEEQKNLVNSFNSLKETVLNIEARLNQFIEKGNKTAGTDVRKAMQDVKNYAQAIRLSVQEIKKD